MKIYLIKQDIKKDYDCYLKHVVVAHNVKQVREISKMSHADEGSYVWATAQVTLQGSYTGTKSHPFILLSDMLDG